MTPRPEELMKRIREQAEACGGWMDIPLVGADQEPFAGPGGNHLRVARNPFMLWALKDFDYAAHDKVRPIWEPVSPPGFRMKADAPLHTDWVLSAGLLDGEEYGLLSAGRDTYAAAVARSVCNTQWDLTRQMSTAQFVVLAKGSHKKISGPAVWAQPNIAVPAGSIAIAPDASPAYQLAMQAACASDKRGASGAIICETGSQIAHLAKVSRELDCTVLMLPGARRRFQPGTYLDIDMVARTISPQL